MRESILSMRWRAMLIALAAAAALLARSAEAQQEAPPPGAPPAASSERAAEQPPSGLFGTISRWVDDSAASFAARLKSTRDEIGSIGEEARSAAQDAASAAARLPLSSVVTGHERCEAASNGAPDCRAAAASLCQAKGYALGRTLDIQTVQKCPAQVWLSGRAPKGGECSSESYVTRVACQ